MPYQLNFDGKSKFKPKAIIFIDFKSAYNNVNLDMLFAILDQNKILDPEEINFLRALYSKTTLTIGNLRTQIRKESCKAISSAQHYLIYS